jgi:hypothetical protein
MDEVAHLSQHYIEPKHVEYGRLEGERDSTSLRTVRDPTIRLWEEW